jgi:hypothetical protein
MYSHHQPAEKNVMVLVDVCDLYSVHNGLSLYYYSNNRDITLQSAQSRRVQILYHCVIEKTRSHSISIFCVCASFILTALKKMYFLILFVATANAGCTISRAYHATLFCENPLPPNSISKYDNETIFHIVFLSGSTTLHQSRAPLLTVRCHGCRCPLICIFEGVEQSCSNKLPLCKVGHFVRILLLQLVKRKKLQGPRVTVSPALLPNQVVIVFLPI